MNFEQVYQDFYDRVFHYVSARITSRSDAEDLVQEIFVACYRNFEHYDPEKASLITWIFVITKSRLINYYRGRKESTSIDDEEHPVEIPAEQFLEEAILLEEKKEVLQRALLLLSDRERRIVSGKYFEGRSSSALAKELGTTPGNIRIIRMRALKKLQADPALRELCAGL